MNSIDERVQVAKHPLILHKVGLLRDKSTSYKQFRELVREISSLLIYEATTNLPVNNIECETPMGKCEVQELAGKIAIVPVLRAGLGMMEGAIQTVPNALIWHLGFYRDETSLEPVPYYNKLDNYIHQVSDPSVTTIVVDPMLATGGTVIAAISTLKEKGAKNIKFVGIIGAPEGLKRICEAHPDVDILLGCLDAGLNNVGFILPGLGDAGDRQFGTF